MYVVTEFYNDGKAIAYLSNRKVETRPIAFDQYFDQVSNNEGVRAWVNEMCIDGDDVEQVYTQLIAGRSVDISGYC